jgi:parallel beta-helix repeat protein
MQVKKSRKGEGVIGISPALVITLLFIVALAATTKLFLDGTSLTGFGVYAPGGQYEQDIALTLTSDTGYDWSLQDHPLQFDLRSVKLDGTLIGSGEVKAYLVNTDGTEYLIIDNSAIQSAKADQVTGLAVSSSQDSTGPSNETPPEDPAGEDKTINIDLAYQSGTRWDADDDGTAFTKADAVDFTVEDTKFSWDAEDSKLCTKWTVISDTGATTSLCNGAADCCGLVQLAPGSDSWKEPFYLYYEQYGSTAENMMEAQIIFLDQSLDPGDTYFESVQSSIASLPAVFVEAPETQFTGACVDTCALSPGLDSPEYTIRFEVEPGTMLKIDGITYVVEERESPEAKKNKTPKASKFDGETTDFQALPDPEDVDNPVIEKTNNVKIRWNNKNRNISGADFDTHVKFGKGWVSVDSDSLNTDLNSSATITLYDLPYTFMPAIYVDGVLCTACEGISYIDGDFTFTVSHFTNYSTGSNSNLSIWDQNDSGMPYSGFPANTSDQIYFFVNYSDNAGFPLNGADCNISFPDMQDISMDYNSSSDLYEFNRTFSYGGSIIWNASCSKTSYESLNASDTLNISMGCGSKITSDTVLTSSLSQTGNGACLNITADYITLDCNGYNISGDNTPNSQGIYALERKNVTIKNCSVTDFEVGIIIESTNSSDVRENEIFGGGSAFCGICVAHDSEDVVISDNKVYGSVTRSLYVENSSDVELSRNNVSGSTTVYHSDDVIFLNQSLESGYNFTESFLSFEILAFGELSFLEKITAIGPNLDQYVNISNNSVFVDALSTPDFNKSANITFYSTDSWGMTNRTPYRNGAACPPQICTELFDTDTYIFNVTGFSNYSVGDAGANGNISAVWLTPVADINVTRNEFFLVRQNITCTGGSCGDVEVTLDPENAGTRQGGRP